MNFYGLLSNCAGLKGKLKEDANLFLTESSRSMDLGRRVPGSFKRSVRRAFVWVIAPTRLQLTVKKDSEFAPRRR